MSLLTITGKAYPEPITQLHVQALYSSVYSYIKPHMLYRFSYQQTTPVGSWQSAAVGHCCLPRMSGLGHGHSSNHQSGSLSNVK